MSSNRILIAKFIREQRESFGWSQRELGRRLGCPQATVHLWESEKSTPDTDNLAKIANLFGLTLSELFKLIEDGEVLDSAKANPWSDLQSLTKAMDVMSRAEIAQIVNAGVQKLAQAA
jgi:transcriptional regulator with XRE-family HTH domain